MAGKGKEKKYACKPRKWGRAWAEGHAPNAHARPVLHAHYAVEQREPQCANSRSPTHSLDTLSCTPAASLTGCCEPPRLCPPFGWVLPSKPSPCPWRAGGAACWLGAAPLHSGTRCFQQGCHRQTRRDARPPSLTLRIRCFRSRCRNRLAQEVCCRCTPVLFLQQSGAMSSAGGTAALCGCKAAALLRRGNDSQGKVWWVVRVLNSTEYLWRCLGLGRGCG